MHRRIVTILCATAAAAALPATAAQAETGIRVYKVTAEGRGQMTAHQDIPNAAGPSSTIDSAAKFSWRVRLPEVGFLANGEAVVLGDRSGVVSGTVTGEATEHSDIVGRDGEGNIIHNRGSCSAPSQSHKPEGPSVTPDPQQGGSPDGGWLTVRPFTGLRMNATCTGFGYPPTTQLGLFAAQGALDQRFWMPRDATRMGKIIQVVAAGPHQRHRCEPRQHQTACTLDWRGTVTFEYSHTYGGDVLTADEIPPLDGDEDDIFVPLPSKASVSRSGSRASVRVECRTRCSGTVRAYAAPRRKAGGSTAKARVLARKRFRARPGRPATVRLRFRGAARRAVKRAGGVRLVITSGKRKRTVTVRP